MSAGNGPHSFVDDPVAREYRAEIYKQIGSVEKAQVALFTQAEERGRQADERAGSTDRRLSAMEAQINKLGDEIRAGRLSVRDILLATSPLSAALLGLIGVLLAGGH
jgi:hypothetical protein